MVQANFEYFCIEYISLEDRKSVLARVKASHEESPSGVSELRASEVNYNAVTNHILFGYDASRPLSSAQSISGRSWYKITYARTYNSQDILLWHLKCKSIQRNENLFNRH